MKTDYSMTPKEVAKTIGWGLLAGLIGGGMSIGLAYVIRCLLEWLHV